jgi:hypothetical protein
MCNLDARHHKKQISSQLLKTNASISVPIVKKVTAAILINESPFDGTLDDWKNSAGFLSTKEENTSPWPSFPSAKNTQDTLNKLRGHINWGY